MKKKVVSLMLVAAMACSMAACGSSNADAGKTDSAAESTTGSDSAASTEAASTGETANNALKIAIVSSPSGVDDGSFNEDNYNGIQNFIKENPDSTVTPIQETTGDTDAAVQAVADIVADTDATGYVSEEGRCQLSAETIDKINAAFDKVKDGTIVPAADATVNDITPEDFEVK